MKTLKTTIGILFFSLLLTGLSSCGVRHYSHYGHHRGWHPGHSKVIVIHEDSRDYRYHQKYPRKVYKKYRKGDVIIIRENDRGYRKPYKRYYW